MKNIEDKYLSINEDNSIVKRMKERFVTLLSDINDLDDVDRIEIFKTIKAIADSGVYDINLKNKYNNLKKAIHDN